jgi:methylenetetrahydrofolate reductase (NADPH)
MADVLTVAGRLARLRPAFVAVTYGAGGGTRERTLELVGRFKRDLGLDPMAHLTCVGHSRAELAGLLDAYAALGIETVLALRGDPPKGAASFAPHPDGFARASELVAFIRDGWGFEVGAACYPENHPESPDWGVEMAALRAKVDAGAAFLVTQMFTDNNHYFALLHRAREAGIEVPILPGVLPLLHLDRIAAYCDLTGRAIAPALRREFELRADDPVASREFGVAYAALQCQELLRAGAPGIHFYPRNRSEATSAILAALQAAQPWLRGEAASRAASAAAVPPSYLARPAATGCAPSP